MTLVEKLKENKKFLTTAGIFVVAQAIDATCTGIGLKNNDVVEGSKIIQDYINHFGITKGLIASKVAMAIPLLILAKAMDTKYKKTEKN